MSEGAQTDAPATAGTGGNGNERRREAHAGLRRRGRTIVLIALAVVVILVGFAGVDRWFYEHVSCALDYNPSFPQEMRFYKLTHPFWDVCRYMFGYGVAALLILGADLADTLRKLERARR